MRNPAKCFCKESDSFKASVGRQNLSGPESFSGSDSDIDSFGLFERSIPIKKNVTIVDDMGQLRPDSESDAAMEMTAAQMEHKSIVELDIRVEFCNCLLPLLGLVMSGGIDVTMNFTEVESTFEEFDRGGAGSRTRSGH